MSRPDAIPSPRHSTLQRFRRIMKWLALLAIAIAAIAVILVASGAEEAPVHLLIATALGVGLTVLLGTGLMALTFLSARGGTDGQASDSSDWNRNDE